MSVLDSPSERRTTAKLVMSAKEYEAWTLSIHRGMSLRSVSYHLDISVSTVRDRLRRAKRKLSEHDTAAVPRRPTPLVVTTITAVPSTRDLTAMIRNLLVQRDGPRCYLCREPVNPNELEVEHIIPRRRGGTDEATNLALACTPCNARKGTRYVSLLATSERAVYHAA